MGSRGACCWSSHSLVGLVCKEPQRFGRAAVRWHGRFCRETQVDLEEAQAVLAALALLAGERRRTAAFALAELLRRRGLERPCEGLVAWASSPESRLHCS